MIMFSSKLSSWIMSSTPSVPSRCSYRLPNRHGRNGLVRFSAPLPPYRRAPIRPGWPAPSTMRRPGPRSGCTWTCQCLPRAMPGNQHARPAACVVCQRPPAGAGARSAPARTVQVEAGNVDARRREHLLEARIRHGGGGARGADGRGGRAAPPKVCARLASCFS